MAAVCVPSWTMRLGGWDFAVMGSCAHGVVGFFPPQSFLLVNFIVCLDVKAGFTVQVNTALKKAVPVGSLLKLEARVLRKEGTRKVWVAAKLEDHESKVVYAEGEGLFLRSLDSV